MVIKTISKRDVQILIDHGLLMNTGNGFVSRTGYHVGFYRTSSGKRYIEDWYVDKVQDLKTKNN